MSNWRQSLALYWNRKILTILLLGFSSGLPLALTFATLSAWLAKEGISRDSIGLFTLVGTPYALKFLWSPLLDRIPPPLPLGRRRGWGILIQLALIGAVLALGTCDPASDLGTMAALAVLVAFLSASQDIVIDAYRVESLEDCEQGTGAGATQTGYNIARIASGAGALAIADQFGWFAAYGVMAGLLGVGLVTFLVSPEPLTAASPAAAELERRAVRFLERRPAFAGRAGRMAVWFYGAIVGPFADFMARPGWPSILLFVFAYKLGEALAGAMAMPLYVDLGFSLTEIAAVSKVFGVGATIAGALVGGVMVGRFGVMRTLLLCGILQSAGNLFYVLQAMAGHQVAYLALCVFAENMTGGMAGAAMVAYISGLCDSSYTATQFALMSSLAALGRTLFASESGYLAQSMGWVPFFLLTTVVTVPALALLGYMMWRPALPRGEAPVRSDPP